MKKLISTLAVALPLMIAESVFSSTPDAWLEFRADVELNCESLAQSLFAETGAVLVDDYGTESYGVALIGAGSEASKGVATCVYEKRTKQAHIAGYFNLKCAADQDCTKQEVGSSTTDWMRLRYSDACERGGVLAPDIPCPFREDATCIGEGCFASGVTELKMQVVLLAEPGSDRSVYTANAGEFLVHETSVTYSVPCQARVLSSVVPELKSGSAVYRLSYAGEGTFRYLIDGRVVASGGDDKIPTAVECPRKEEQWSRLKAEGGIVGWALLDYEAFLGTSIHDPLTQKPPEWIRRASAPVDEMEQTAAPAPTPRAGQADEWGPGIVPDGSIELGDSPCADKEVGSCLAELGLPNEAISFTIAAGGDLAGESFATEFVELGKVDLARISYPFSPWEGPVLLNGTPSIVTPSGDSNNLGTAFKDSASRKFLARFPKATGWSYGVSGHRVMPHGGQRFVVATTMQDSCRACPIVGTAIAFLDVHADGRQLSRHSIGLMDTSNGLLGDSEEWGAKVLTDHPAYLQYRLNLLGYGAGPMDGVPGQQTTDALIAFQREQCIPTTGELDGATLEKLSSADRYKAPCAESQPGLASSELCDGADCPPSEENPESTVYTPPKGSAERNGIMDAIRENYSQKDVLFLVHYLKVSGDWAWARVTGTVKGEPAYESDSALVRKISGEWTTVASQNHSGECDNDPVCYEDDRTGRCVFNPVCSEQGYEKLIAKLKAKYPDVPLGIIEGHEGESPTARQLPRIADNGKPVGSDPTTSGSGDAGSSVSETHGAQCVPAKTSNSETECEFCEPVLAGLYQPKEVHQANFDGEEGHKYRYEWKGGCSNGSIDGFGTLTVFANEVDFFELLANERSGVLFRSGAPIIAVPAEAVDVRLSSGAVLATPGTCPSSDRLMIWAIVEGPVQMHSSSVAEQVLRFARQRAVESCPSLEGVRYELHVVERQAVDKPGSSKASKAFTNPLETLRRKPNTPSQENEAASSVQKFITEWLGGTRYGDYVSCKGSKLSPDSNCDLENYSTFIRAHAREMHQRHSARVRAEQERQQRAAAEAQRRAQETKAAESQKRLDAELSSLTQRAERFLNEGIGTPAELATALQVDERRTLKRLERGAQLDVEPVEGIRTVGHGGKNYYGVTYHATSLIADAEKRNRDQQMKEKFSWSGWFDQTSSVGSARKLELTCLFRTASDIPKERQRVGAKLISLNSVGKNISIAIECAAGAPVGDNTVGERGELSREQAARLIQRKRGLPQQTTITVGKSYAKRFQRVHQYTPGICITYGGHQWDSDVKLLTTLEEKRLITLSKERKITEHNCHRWWVDIGLTPEGRNYLVGESQQEYTFRTADITINEVTGLIFNEGKTMAIAEYNFKAVNVTPFAIEKVSVPKGRKETLLLYDDGWRIAK